MSLDLVIANGRVFDPGAGLIGTMHVGIHGGRVVEVGPQVDVASAGQVIDASGLLVVPGLIDLHTHAYWGATYWGIRPDPVAARSGVTTWVDAGSAGAYNLPGLVSFIGEASRVRLRCFLNVSSVGLTPRDHEVALLQFCDVPALLAVAERYREIVVGVKVRISLQTVAGLGIRPLELAVRAAEELELPVMVHIGQGPPELSEILDLLRPGDIVTHCFTGRSMALAGEGGEILEPVREARRRGVVFDVGHGSGSFTFRSAEAALRQDFPPDVISSDIHQLSVSGPVFDLPSCMTKLLAVGMSLNDVVCATTRRPAEVLRLYPEIGTLQPGAAGDVALLELREGEVTLHDIELQERATSARLVPRGTIVAGQLMAPLAEDAPAPWVIRTGDWKHDHLANNDPARLWPAVSEAGE